MCFSNRRRGFTIIELMVCIAIVALLCAMLLPAIIRVRDAAAQIESKNNLRQMMIAIHHYENDFKRLPWLAGESPVLVQLLPYIEEENALVYWQKYRDTKLVIKTYLSPSDPTLTDTSRAYSLASYAVNAQVFFKTRSMSKGIPDGASHTIGISEHYAYRIKYTNFSWGVNYPTDVTYPDPPVYIYTHRATFADNGPGILSGGMVQLNDAYPIKNLTTGLTMSSIPGMTFQCRPSIEKADPRVPQTPHLGMLVAMMDGSVHSIASNISEHVFWGSVTPAGSEAIGDEFFRD